MIRVKQGNLTLRLIREEDLELLRTWRNSAPIRMQMEHNQLISADEHVNWFKELKSNRDFYFVADYSNQDFAIANIKNVDKYSGTGEVGLFLGSTDLDGSPAPFIASLALLDFSFGILAVNEVRAKVKKSNSKAIQYNSWLGLQFSHEANHDFNYYSLTKREYLGDRKTKHRLLKITSAPQILLEGVHEELYDEVKWREVTSMTE